MIINIVSGSPFNIDLLKKYQADFYIGVDYGAFRLIENNYKIDIAIGDFDSISTDQFVNLLHNCSKVIKYHSEKSQTDTEIALEYAMSINPSQINLFGVTGKRIDHFLGVINLFMKVINHNINLRIIDKHNRIYAVKPGTHNIKKSDYKYISFFSYNGPVKNLTTNKFKYDLNNHLLNNEDSLCISNEIIGEYGIVEFTEGILLIVESKD